MEKTVKAPPPATPAGLLSPRAAAESELRVYLRGVRASEAATRAAFGPFAL
jgi:hypothetical protein